MEPRRSGISIKRRKKKPTKAQSQYAQDVAAQKAAENYASMAVAAASKYSQPPPPPPPPPVISEDPLGGDVQVMGEKTITERVPESLPVDPIVTSIRGDGRCHVAAIQAAKNGLDYWIRVSRYANGTAIINKIASEEQTMSGRHKSISFKCCSSISPRRWGLHVWSLKSKDKLAVVSVALSAPCLKI